MRHQHHAHHGPNYTDVIVRRNQPNQEPNQKEGTNMENGNTGGVLSIMVTANDKGNTDCQTKVSALPSRWQQWLGEPGADWGVVKCSIM